MSCNRVDAGYVFDRWRAQGAGITKVWVGSPLTNGGAVIQSGDRKSVDERNNTLSERSMVDNIGVLVFVFRYTGCL